ncbi:DNA topoisomerase 1 [Frankliniella fusca]|uniref:DNA topoisomerase I n=1 Tax=Frankliniella fusca TaxID=407009 RepID=A0AAE1HKZ7_9NEOP|nr:DNA topoisomerase 1 [Frankliniella fusca]
MAEVLASDGRDPYEEKCVKEYSNGTASEGSNHIQMNGVTNGHSADKLKDKHRDKDKHHKDKHRDKDRDKHRDKDKDKDRSKHSSSSKDKDKHSSSSSSKEKDKNRDKDHKSSSSSKDKDRDRDKSSSKDKDRSDKNKSSSSSGHKSSSSSSKDKEKSSSSSSSKDKEKSHSSSSKDKEKDRSKDKEKEREKDKHKDRSKDKEKERKDKDRKSSDGDRHKDKERSKDKSKHDGDRRDKYKDKEREKKYEEKVEVKQEIGSPVTVKEERISLSPLPVKREDTDDSMDDTSLNMDSFKKEEYSSFKEEQSSMDESYMEQSSMLSVQKEESDDEDSDAPLASRKSVDSSNKRKAVSDSEEDKPLMARAAPKKVKKEIKKEVKKRKSDAYDSEDEDLKPKKKKKAPPVKQETQTSPKKKKKEEEEQQVWKWWEEEKKEDGVKWRFLEHKGPLFAPPYERLPDNVKFSYDGKEMDLSELAEEVATFYAKMLEHDYTTKPVFNNNFFKDWRKVMTDRERSIITDLKKCNFKPMNKYFNEQSEIRKAMSKEEKKKIKEKNDEIQKEMGFCTIDGHQEKIGNFRIEPPGLFRGRGEHPKMGMLKKRVNPEDVIINCSKDSVIPKAPAGHRWKEVRHDNKVTWLASWTENVQGQVKYVMLNPSSKLKGEKDWQKYETARKLAKTIDKIREDYRQDWKSKEMRIRQRAVAMYFIDKLALRAGNEKDEDQADTVGCCSLRVEHISLEAEKDGKENVVIFDFPGKDSIRYYNEVPVEKRVFKNLQLFMEKKQGGDDLFDRLNTGILNKHLSDLMEGLTAKVFRTYNASWTLQEQLNLLTNPDDTVAEKILAYNRANRAVAILCNHQRSIPKSHDKSMENLKGKIEAKREQLKEAEQQYKDAKRSRSAATDKKKKALDRIREQLNKLEIQETDREENKTIALGTSKLNYLDPRISVAWCKKHDVPIEKIYNKTQRDKFRWAIDMAEADYVF